MNNEMKHYTKLLDDLVEDFYGHKHKLASVISKGGQGAVFRTPDPTIAVKVAFGDKNNSSGDEDKDMVLMNDSQNDEFKKIRLLPLPKNINLTLPKATLKTCSGYVMSLLEDMDSFYNLLVKADPVKNDWVKQFFGDSTAADDYGTYIASGSSRRRYELYLRFAAELAKLHCAGLVFCDVSLNNVFASSSLTHRNVWLIDCDNVAFQLKTSKGYGAMTPRYSAPEVFTSEADPEFTMYSDCYAFALCFFYALTYSHPFEGKACLELPPDAADDLITRSAVPWIFDRDDDSNSVGNTRIEHADIISDELMELFDRTFNNVGRNEDVLARPTMPEWGCAISHAADRTVMCPKCQMSSINNGQCQWCGKKIPVISIKVCRDESCLDTAWEYVHEIETDTVDVPLRVIKGYFVEEADETAFRIKPGDMTGISSFSRGWEISDAAVDDTAIGSLYGGFEFKDCFSFTAVCKDISKTVYVRGEIKR